MTIDLTNEEVVALTAMLNGGIEQCQEALDVVNPRHESFKAIQHAIAPLQSMRAKLP